MKTNSNKIHTTGHFIKDFQYLCLFKKIKNKQQQQCMLHVTTLYVKRNVCVRSVLRLTALRSFTVFTQNPLSKWEKMWKAQKAHNTNTDHHAAEKKKRESVQSTEETGSNKATSVRSSKLFIISRPCELSYAEKKNAKARSSPGLNTNADLIYDSVQIFTLNPLSNELSWLTD